MRWLKRFGKSIRNRPQAIFVAAASASFALLLSSVVPSCGQQAGPTSTAPGQLNLPTVPEGDEPVIRVRLLDEVAGVALTTTGPYTLYAEQQVLDRSQRPFDGRITRQGGRWSLPGRRLTARYIRLSPAAGGVVKVNGHPYRGQVVLLEGVSSPDTLRVNNDVDIEGYLAGVLARELYSSWHPEAFAAQAVAARTYALYEKLHDGASRSFDVYADQRSQVYGGIEAETPKASKAVDRTRGQYLVYGANDLSGVFKTYYSSCCGGMTSPANALEPQDRDIPPLAGGVRCTDCGGSRHSRPHTVIVPKAEVWPALSRTYEKVAQLGGIKEIRTISTTPWGRPVKVGIYGPSGGDTQIRADDLRLVLLRNRVSGSAELKSMFCTIRDDGRNLVFENVRGFGHGVGMCQFGAEGKALRGLNYKQILASYYPQSRIHKAY